MSIFDLTPQPPKPSWKAVIAFGGEEGLDTAILWCSPDLLSDLKENGCRPDDCFESAKPGVFIWEGHIHGITYPSTPNGPEEYDVEYRGTLRDLTDAEWASLREGKNPLHDELKGSKGTHRA
jgi:hypothetical protein